jgi:hypothetical protein
VPNANVTGDISIAMDGPWRFRLNHSTCCVAGSFHPLYNDVCTVLHTTVHDPGQQRRLISAVVASESLYQPAFGLGPPPCLSRSCVAFEQVGTGFFPISNLRVPSADGGRRIYCAASRSIDVHTLTSVIVLGLVISLANGDIGGRGRRAQPGA